MLGGEVKLAAGRAAEETLAGEPEGGVILGGRPCGETVFDRLLHGIILSLDGADPEPGQYGVDGEIGDAAEAEQRLGGFEAWGAQGPVGGPERIARDLEYFHQRGAQTRIGNLQGAPAFEFGGEIPGGEPMGGQRQAPLGLIGRALAVQSPYRGGQQAFFELDALAPPLVPNAAQVTVGAVAGADEVAGQQAGDAEEAGL